MILLLYSLILTNIIVDIFIGVMTKTIIGMIVIIWYCHDGCVHDVYIVIMYSIISTFVIIMKLCGWWTTWFVIFFNLTITSTMANWWRWTILLILIIIIISIITLLFIIWWHMMTIDVRDLARPKSQILYDNYYSRRNNAFTSRSITYYHYVKIYSFNLINRKFFIHLQNVENMEYFFKSLNLSCSLSVTSQINP